MSSIRDIQPGVKYTSPQLPQGNPPTFFLDCRVQYTGITRRGWEYDQRSKTIDRPLTLVDVVAETSAISQYLEALSYSGMKISKANRNSACAMKGPCPLAIHRNPSNNTIKELNFPEISERYLRLVFASRVPEPVLLPVLYITK